MPTYIVLAHDNPAMLRKLVGSLGESPIHIHLDLGTNLDDFESVAKISSFPNADYVHKRVQVNWGGYSVSRATAAATSQSLTDTEPDEHVVFLSGHCYPIRPIDQFEQYLRTSPWKVHARAYSLSDFGGWHARRYRERHRFDGFSARIPSSARNVRRMLRATDKALARLKPPISTELDVVAGSQWMALPRDCAAEAIAAMDEPEFHIFRDSFAPDEMAIQTFVHNSPWRENTEHQGPEISDGKVATLPNFHMLDTPMEGTVSKLRLRSPSAREFFARKFYMPDDLGLMNGLY